MNARLTERDGAARQVLDPDASVSIPLVDLSRGARPGRRRAPWMRERMSAPLPPDGDRLFHTALLRLGPDLHRWFLRAHHTILDAYSGLLISRRAAEVYTLLADGGEYVPAELGDYRALLAAEDAYRRSERFERDRAYWTERFADKPVAVSLSDEMAEPTSDYRSLITVVPPGRPPIWRRAPAAAHRDAGPRDRRDGRVRGADDRHRGRDPRPRGVGPHLAGRPGHPGHAVDGPAAARHRAPRHDGGRTGPHGDAGERAGAAPPALPARGPAARSEAARRAPPPVRAGHQHHGVRLPVRLRGPAKRGRTPSRPARSTTCRSTSTTTSTATACASTSSRTPTCTPRTRSPRIWTVTSGSCGRWATPPRPRRSARWSCLTTPSAPASWTSGTTRRCGLVGRRP